MKLSTIQAEAGAVLSAGTAVISDEVAAVSPAWRSYVPKWMSYSLAKKAFAIALPVLVLGTAYTFGADVVGGIGRSLHIGGGADMSKYATKADLATYATRADLLAATKSEGDNAIEVMATHAASADDVAELKAEIEQLKAKLAPPITTGSIPVKKKKKAAAPEASSLLPSWLSP